MRSRAPGRGFFVARRAATRPLNAIDSIAAGAISVCAIDEFLPDSVIDPQRGHASCVTTRRPRSVRRRKLTQRLLEHLGRLAAADQVALVEDHRRHRMDAGVLPLALGLAHLGGKLVARQNLRRPRLVQPRLAHGGQQDRGLVDPLGASMVGLQQRALERQLGVRPLPYGIPPAARCRSSVVEHPLGKGEVDSSILSSSTSNLNDLPHTKPMFSSLTSLQL